jgi:ABC-2 type transport system ATP-binding protein
LPNKERGLGMPDRWQTDNLAVEVRNLTKRYGQVVAVDRVSFEVRRGELFGFLGPNGAGKTTTVRMLTGVIKADSGTVLVMGFRAGSLRAKQVTGVVPEMANAYADLSGWDNLMLMAELYGISPAIARKRGESLLKALGLLERKDSLVRTYSKGMKQRLILCMALVSDPEVLFLDEPTSGLDVQSPRLIKDLLRSLNAGGKTIFLTTHDMDEANELCDRVAIINKGRIVAIDAPEKLRMATRGMHSVEISFTNTVNPEVLAQLPGVNAVRRSGDKYRLYTDAPGDLVVSLVNYSSLAGLKIVSLNILAPSLEDAFVALTEKEAKDA